MKKVAIDLFACSGGFSHGWIQGGGEIAVAVDSWGVALANHAFNHPNVPILKRELGHDLEAISQELRTYLPSDEEFHFHLHGSPPCQAISTASNHDAEEGMRLVNWFLALVAYMKPDSWSMENVVPVAKRLPDGIPYVELNAADFGVPQMRKRIFAGSGWSVKRTHIPRDYFRVSDVLDMKGIDRIVSRRRKKGETPQFYSPFAPAHTITQCNHMLERLLPDGTYDVVRSLNIGELATLQGWSDMRFMPGIGMTFATKKEMVANMVCPPIAKAICEGIL